MAVRCVMAGKSKENPAGLTFVSQRHKLVMHVLSDIARASTRHPTYPNLYLPIILICVRAGSLLSMRCSNSSGRSGCTSAKAGTGGTGGTADVALADAGGEELEAREAASEGSECALVGKGCGGGGD